MDNPEDNRPLTLRVCSNQALSAASGRQPVPAISKIVTKTFVELDLATMRMSHSQ